MCALSVWFMSICVVHFYLCGSFLKKNKNKKMAVAKGLLSAAQHSRRGRPIALTVHNVTTARDLQAHRASAARWRTSHAQLARNNLSTLKGLNAQPGVTVTVRADAGPPPARLQRIADQAAQSGGLRSNAPSRLRVLCQRPVGRT